MLIPWEADQIRGTIWAVSHTSRDAFELPDYELLKSLYDYVGVIMRQQKLDQKAREIARAQASTDRAHEMAHQINNPLQSLTNTMFLASLGGPDAPGYIDTALRELAALSERVRKLLALKYDDDPR